MPHANPAFIFSQKKYMRNLFLIIALCIGPVVLAQETENIEPLGTDRPGAGTPPGLISKDFLQLETGGQYEHYRYGNEESTISTLIPHY